MLMKPLITLVIPSLLLICPLGCGNSQPAAGKEHLEHFVPAHKPANFSEAVEEIQDRAEHLGQHTGHSHDDEAAEFQELRDIVNWLPELAADSDLNESDWNAASTAAKLISEKLGQRRAADASLSLKELSAAIDTELQNLKSLVAAAGKPEPSMHHEHHHDHHHHEDQHPTLKTEN